MKMKATKLAAILSRLHSAWRLPQATLALALAIAALASPARADGELPSGYTALTDHNGGLYKAAIANQILVTDYYPNENTWMEIDLEFGTSGNDGENWSASYFMGLAGFPNGHQLNGCLARYIVAGGSALESGKMSFWCDSDVSGSYDGFEIYRTQLTPYDGRQTLKLEYGKVSLSNTTTSASTSATSDYLKRSGKTDGPVSIFGYRYMISAQPYHSRDMTVYSWKIYESDNGQDGGVRQELKCDFCPAHEDDSGKDGLYDKVSGKFYPLNDLALITVSFNKGSCPLLDPLGMANIAYMNAPKDVMLPDFPEVLVSYCVPPTTSPNKKFGGFFDAETGGNQYYDAGGKAMCECPADGAYLFAQWVDKTYKISYNLNGGGYPGSEPTKTAVFGDQFQVNAPERKGYRFVGWTADNYASGATYASTQGGDETTISDGSIPCTGDIWVKNLRGENDENTVILTAQWEIALPPEYEKLDCLDNGSDILTAGFVQVTGFHFDVSNAVALTYCINDTTYQWQNLFFSHHIENGGSRTEFGLCYPNLLSEDPMSFHHGIDDKAGSIQNAGVSDKNVTNTLVLAETGSTFNGSPISFGGTQPSPLAGRSLPNDLLIFCSDNKAYSDGYPYNDSGRLCGPALVKIFSFKVMANGADSEVILNLVPAKRKAGDVEGFYDVVNGGFYPLRHRCAGPTEIASHAVETWQETAATESECGYKCGVCTDCLMRISQMILPTQPTRSWPYDGANHKPTISNTNDVMGKAGCTVTYSPAGEWKAVGPDYTVTYALTPGHVWSDGTTEAKTISYSIVPADGADFYVTADADGSGNGSSWASPFTFQEALNAVKGAAKDVTNTIYMKEGTYTNPSGPWTATINPCFIRILGGYTGVNLARSQTEYTVLDGENAHGLVSLTVSRGSSTGSKSILFDQIEFRNGQGAYRIKNNDLYNYWSQFNHCRFIDNFVPAGDTTTRGSAIEVEKGSGYSTGTMVSWVCVENCEFRGNKSCSDSATTIYSADKVGDYYAGIKLSHSLFVGNSSKVLPCVAQFGGSKDNNVTIESCTFAYNAAATETNRNDSNGGTTAGGGVVLDEIDTNEFTWKVSNTIFFGNRCKEKEDKGKDAREYWVTNPKGNPKPTYLLYEKKEGYEWCFGNGTDGDAYHYMVGDPMFVTPLPAAVEFDANYNPTWYVDSSKTATVAPSAMDVHLQSKEGRWTGSAWVNDTVDSPALDAGDPAADFAAEPSPNGARINLGAYGNTAEASKSLAPIVVTAPDVVGYEGSPTQIAVKVTAPATGYTITYSETEDGEYTATNPQYSEFGVYRVYWKVTAANYEEEKGSALVSIAKKAAGEYVRLTVTKRKGSSGESDFQFSELALYEDISGNERINLNLELADGLAELKETAGTCYAYPTNCWNSQDVHRLFDGGSIASGSKLCCPRNSTSTDPTDAHIQIYMHLPAANAAKIIRSYNLQSADDTMTWKGRSPTAWRLEVSSDCERWTIIDEKTVADTKDDPALNTNNTWYNDGVEHPYPIKLNYVPMEVLETNPYAEGTDAYKAVANYIQIVGFRLEADDVVTAKVRYNNESKSDYKEHIWDTIFCQRDSSGEGMFSVFRRFDELAGTCVRFDYGDKQLESEKCLPTGVCEYVASASGLTTNGFSVTFKEAVGTWKSAPDNSLLLFASDDYLGRDGVAKANQAYLKCYYFKVADSTTAGSPLRLDLVPASNTVSHAQGLYDCVSGNFYPLQDATNAGKTTLSGSNTKVTFSKELTAIKDETAGWNQFPLVTEVTNRVGYLTTITNYWQQEWVPAEVTGPGEYRLVMRGQGPYAGAVTNFYTVCASVTLSPNGGTAGTTNRVLALPGKVLPAITGAGALPTKSGCLFLGYWTEAEGGVKYYNADGTSAMEAYPVTDAPTTLYAHWLEGYEPLAKLNFDGTHFILTDYVPISNTWIETEMQAMGNRVSGSAALFGFFEKLRGEAVDSVYGFNAELATSGSGSAVYGWVLGVNNNSGGRGRMWWGNNGWSYLANKCKVQFGYTGFTMSDGSTTIRGEVRPGIKFDMDNCFPCHTALVIGGYNGAVPSGAGSPGYGTPVRPYSLTDGGLDVYSFKIYESANGDPADAEQTLVHNFIPVTRTGDGKEGFYDVVAGEFLPLKTETVVTLDRNGGDNLETNYVYAIAGEKLPSPIDVPTRGGYEFLGYNDQEDGKGTMYYNADGTSNETLVYPDENGPATLYAQWEEYKYHVINPVSGPEIVVNYEWLANAYGSGMSKAEYQQKLFTTNKYGVVNWQAYILGYEADELEMAAILEESVQNTNPETVTIRLRDWEAREKRTAETGCTLKYTLLAARTPGELMTGGGTVVTNLDKTAEFLKWPDWSFEAPLRDLSDKEPVNYYRIKVHFIFGGGGEGEKVAFTYATPIDGTMMPVDGWTLGLTSSDDIAYNLAPINTEGFGYVSLKYDVKSKFDVCRFYVNFLQESGDAIVTSGVNANANDGFNEGEFVGLGGVYRIPDDCGKISLRWGDSNVARQKSIANENTDMLISNVEVKLMDYQKAAAVADDIFANHVNQTAWNAAIDGKIDSSAGAWTRNLSGLQTALTSGKEYKVLMMGDSTSCSVQNGCIEALIKRQWPNSNIKFYLMWKQNSGCYYFAGHGGRPEVSEYALNFDYSPYDLIVFSGISQTRYSPNEVTAISDPQTTCYNVTNSVREVMEMIRSDSLGDRKNTHCEFVMMSPLLSVDSRKLGNPYDVADYATDAAIYWEKVGEACAVVTDWDVTNDPWAKRDYIPIRTGMPKFCEDANIAHWDLFPAAYDYLYRSGMYYHYYSRDAVHPNSFGYQVCARLFLEALKIVGGVTE